MKQTNRTIHTLSYIPKNGNISFLFQANIFILCSALQAILQYYKQLLLGPTKKQRWHTYDVLFSNYIYF